MVIVFDAGPFAADRSMKKTASRALLAECAEERIRVVIPRVVLEEVISATAGYLRNAAKSLESAQHNLDETFLSPQRFPTLDVDALVDDYRHEIEQTLRDHKVEVAEWHSVSHDEVVARDLARKPPFDESGRGYRDTLTWHVIRDLVLDEDEKVIFITRDQDFSESTDNSEALHPVLLDEIGGNPDAVVIVPDIAAAIRRLGQVRQDLRESLAQTIEERNVEIASAALADLDHLFPYGLEGKEASGELQGVAVQDVVEAWDVLTASAHADLSFEYTGTLNEAEYNYLLETATPADMWLMESDWNEEQRYATVWGAGVVEVLIEVTAEREDDTYVMDVVGAREVEHGEENGDGRTS